MDERNSAAIRPRQFALLVLASGNLSPRVRARDQQADRAGLDLQRRLLEKIAESDPEPESFEAALLRFADEMATPPGPARAVAAVVWDEWQAATTNPVLVEHLLSEAIKAEARLAPRQ